MKKKISIFEIVWYSICIIAMVAGLAFVVLGLVGEFGGKSVEVLKKFSTPGYICLPVGAALMVIVLLITAKTSDRANEAAARRAARLAQANANKAE